MSISKFSWEDLANRLKSGTPVEVYTKDFIPGGDRPKMLIPDNTTASGSVKNEGDTIQIQRGQATVTITNAPLAGYDDDFDPLLERSLGTQYICEKLYLDIGPDAAAPSLALDVLKTISKDDQGVAVIGKEIYPLQPLKRTKESSPSDQQPPKHRHIDTTER